MIARHRRQIAALFDEDRLGKLFGFCVFAVAVCFSMSIWIRVSHLIGGLFQ